jgi:cobalt-zinc-cadmium efflux system outer membrane protein
MTTHDRSSTQLRRALPLIAAALGLAVLGGCATVQRDARFPQAQEAASSRLEKNVVWNRDSEQDKHAKEAVRRLLQRELSVDAAVQVALLNNRNLQAQFENLGIAQADLVEAGLLDNPVFSITFYTGNSGTITEASVVQDFVSLLSLAARKKVGEAGAQRITLGVANSVVSLARDVQAQYYTVVGDAQALELARQVVTSTDAAAELAERQRAAGNLSRRDQNIQQVFYAQTLLELAQAETQVVSDREKLTRLMGVWGADTRWRIPSRLPSVPETLPSPDELESRAVAQRLDLAAAKKEADAAAQALNLTRQFRYLGLLGVGVAYKREPGGDKFVGPTVELGLPIFNQRQGAVARAEAEVKRSQERVTALAVDVRSEAREAQARLAAARGVVQHYQKVLLPLQQTITAETLKFYNGMLLGVYDLLLAQQNQVQTARQYVAASKEFWVAWTDLERALGGKVAVPTASSPTANLSTSRSAPSSSQDGGATADHSQQHGDK